jgi:hypothetical protein
MRMQLHMNYRSNKRTQSKLHGYSITIMNWTIDMIYNVMMKRRAQDLIDTTLVLNLDYTQNNLSM